VFQNNIHNLRGIAILGIVGAHSIHAFDWSDSMVWFRIFDTLCNQSSILFFFIAGYLFQYLSARFAYSRYMKRKLTTVLVPYLILSTPALVVSTGWGAGAAFLTGNGEPMIPQDSVWQGFYDLPAWQQMIAFYATGKHLAPFWFVPTIALFYVIAPILLAADRRKWIYALLPLFMAWSAYAGRDYFFGPIGKGTYLFSVYLMGMFFSRYQSETMRWATRLRWPLILAAAALFYLNVTLEQPHHGILYGLKVCLAPIALYWLREWDAFLGKKFDYLAHVSFGLFFVHGYFISGLRLIYERSTQRPLPDGNVVYYLAFAAVILALSLAVLATARKVLKDRSRLLVGC
jgi:surface polysaccharide O-acyltransferase-like enzyme